MIELASSIFSQSSDLILWKISFNPAMNRIASVPSAIRLEPLPLVPSPDSRVVLGATLCPNRHVYGGRQPSTEKLSDYLSAECPEDDAVDDDVDGTKFFGKAGHCKRALTVGDPVVQ